MIKLSEIQTKYGDYLVDEDKLKELLVKPEQKTVWDLESHDVSHDVYYYIDDDYSKVNSCDWLEDEIDLSRRKCGNAFLTEEEAEFKLECLKCESIMLKYGRRTFNNHKNNIVIVLCNGKNRIETTSFSYYGIQGAIYFDTEELAQQAIDEISEERLKKYVFRIEE